MADIFHQEQSVVLGWLEVQFGGVLLVVSTVVYLQGFSDLELGQVVLELLALFKRGSIVQAVFALVGQGEITVPQGAALVSGNPAKAIGLDDRGVLEVGRRADIVRVHVQEMPAVAHHPSGAPVPVVRGVWREGERVA